MSPLGQAAAERIDEFRLDLEAYKKSEPKASYAWLGNYCEVGPWVLKAFLKRKRKLSHENLYKIHLATGIPL